MRCSPWLALVAVMLGCVTSPPLPSSVPAALPTRQAVAGPLRLSGTEASVTVPLAITFDDLPGNAPLPEDVTRDQVMERILKALARHDITQAVGFANGVGLEQGESARAAMKRWQSAGFAVGNHTYSHRSANTMTRDELRDEVLKNETALAPMLNARPGTTRYFRFPYLERGQTAEEREANEAMLRELGYTVAEVSIDHNDWAFTDAYLRCRAQGNPDVLARLSTVYLDFAMASFHWAIDSAEETYGRPIAHVLLLHATQATADNLEALLTALERAGASFISLEEALKDPAYALPIKDRAGSSNIILEAMHAQNSPRNGYVPRPLPLLELVCR